MCASQTALIESRTHKISTAARFHSAKAPQCSIIRATECIASQKFNFLAQFWPQKPRFRALFRHGIAENVSDHCRARRGTTLSSTRGEKTANCDLAGLPEAEYEVKNAALKR